MSATGRGRRRAASNNKNVKKPLSASSRPAYHCDYCGKDISNVIRIRCAQCADFDLCLECFSVGVELPPHSNSHSYRVIDNLSFPLYHPSWGADEELLLLEGLDMYGVGNWGAVSEHVGLKPPAECRAHYFQVYIDPNSYPLPTPVAGMDAIDIQEYIRSNRRAGQPLPPAAGSAQLQPAPGGAQPASHPSIGGPCPHPTSSGVGAARGEAEEPPSKRHKSMAPETMGIIAQSLADLSGDTPMKDEGAMTGIPSVMPHTAGLSGPSLKSEREGMGKKSTSDQKEGAPTEQTGPPVAAPTSTLIARLNRINDHSCTGFHVLRNEFDPEYDNEAEVPIAEIEFSPDDSEELRDRKLSMLRIYNTRLDERERRRKAVVDLGLLDVRSMQAAEKSRTPAARATHARMRPFARFQSPAQHDHLVNGLILEAHMRARLAELSELRRAGVRTFQEAEVYERGLEARARSADQTAAALARSALQAAAAPPPLGPSPSGSPSIATLQRPLSLGSLPAAVETAPRSTSSWLLPPTGGGTPAIDGGLLGQPHASRPPPSTAQPGARPQGEATAPKVDTSTQDKILRGLSEGCTSCILGCPGKDRPGTAIDKWRATQGLALDITAFPGVELLCDKEMELCQANRLLPAHYLTIKDCLLRQRHGHGSLSSQDVSQRFHIHPERAQEVLELLTSVNWLLPS